MGEPIKKDTMQKSKNFYSVKFSSEKLKEAIKELRAKLPSKVQISRERRRIEIESETWTYDNDGEFFADFQKAFDYAHYEISFHGDFQYSFDIRCFPKHETNIAVEAPTRGEIEDVFHVFEKDLMQYRIEKSNDEREELVIFIGHGQSHAWRDLKDHLADKHGYKIEAFETGARAGHTIRDILDEMLSKSSLAFLVLTGEDETKGGQMNARQNVIHETGLFQGKLGFGRAIVLLEEGTSEFSNLHGIQQIRFSRNNIKESFGEVLATIKREFYS